ncbi:hypothetical protein [Geodermatophilus ruber]|uniref:Camelysin metallo-endopeptidase n=1 Tax=Geodermatophilus ruber TaxID=504800 RepID=A0A1I4DW91_9ACTN|nr:hypothetical protein [Geodermatophilus ruber]SFK97705.1 hypothetical protein SAMN04488085_10581 [Geodermatophilus ruber]
MTAQPTRPGARARIAASIGVLGVAAAVAGLGTFGTFTDSTTPVITEMASGVLSIELSKAADAATLSLFDNGTFLAGDSESSAIDLVNSGTVPLSQMRLTSVATQSSVLDSDTGNGLQLTVESCSEEWDLREAGWHCAGTTTPFYDGPIVLDEALVGAAGLAPGQVDHLLLTASLPGTTEADLVRGATSALDFTFFATQRNGAPR